MFDEKDLIFPLPPDADASYYCHVLQERGAYIKQLKAGTLYLKDVHAAYPKSIKNKAPAMQLEGLVQIIAATEDLTSPEQLKWVKKQPLYEDGQLVAIGTLQINGGIQAMPMNSVYNGDILQYNGLSQLAITDTVIDKALQFIWLASCSRNDVEQMLLIFLL